MKRHGKYDLHAFMLCLFLILAIGAMIKDMQRTDESLLVPIPKHKPAIPTSATQFTMIADK